MHDLPLSCQHVQTVENCLLSAQILQKKHATGHLGMVLNLLDLLQVFSHLLCSYLNQAIHRLYFVFELFDHSLERLGASLSILRECKDFCLESGTNARNSVSNMLAFLEHKHKDCLNLNRAIKVFQLEVTLVEARENFTSGQTENQFFKRSLFRRGYGA